MFYSLKQFCFYCLQEFDPSEIKKNLHNLKTVDSAGNEWKVQQLLSPLPSAYAVFCAVAVIIMPARYV